MEQLEKLPELLRFPKEERIEILAKVIPGLTDEKRPKIDFASFCADNGHIRRLHDPSYKFYTPPMKRHLNDGRTSGAGGFCSGQLRKTIAKIIRSNPREMAEWLLDDDPKNRQKQFIKVHSRKPTDLSAGGMLCSSFRLS